MVPSCVVSLGEATAPHQSVGSSFEKASRSQAGLSCLRYIASRSPASDRSTESEAADSLRRIDACAIERSYCD